jgi:hypothetical protein
MCTLSSISSSYTSSLQRRGCIGLHTPYSSEHQHLTILLNGHMQATHKDGSPLCSPARPQCLNSSQKQLLMYTHWFLQIPINVLQDVAQGVLTRQVDRSLYFELKWDRKPPVGFNTERALDALAFPRLYPSGQNHWNTERGTSHPGLLFDFRQRPLTGTLDSRILTTWGGQSPPCSTSSC